MKGVGNMGSTIKSSSVNKHVLIELLGLRQHSNTTIFTKGNVFVLSPSVQNSHSWFDLRKVNVDRFDDKVQKGLLIIRYFDKLLVTNFKEFKEKMLPEDKTVFTKVMGTHWKFNIVKQVEGFAVINQQNRDFKYPLTEVTSKQLKELI